MHEMTDEVLNFKCSKCGAGVPFVTTSNNMNLKCMKNECGTPISLLKVSPNYSAIYYPHCKYLQSYFCLYFCFHLTLTSFLMHFLTMENIIFPVK